MVFIYYAVSLCSHALSPSHFYPRAWGYMRDDFPVHTYTPLSFPYFMMEISSHCTVNTKGYDMILLHYPRINAHINMRYGNTIKHIDSLKKEIENNIIRISHRAFAVKATQFSSQDTQGCLYTIEGNVATPLAFYIHDFSHHFIYGVAYFDHRPSYDSLFPSIEYIKKDITHMMESFYH